MTNIVVGFTVLFTTNVVDLPHPSGMELVRITTVTEQHVLNYTNEGQVFFLTNDVGSIEYRKRFTREWKEAPMVIEKPRTNILLHRP